MPGTEERILTELGCGDLIHELTVAGGAVRVGQAARAWIHAMPLPIVLLRDPALRDRRALLLADETAHAANGKHGCLTTDRHNTPRLISLSSNTLLQNIENYPWEGPQSGPGISREM